MQLAAFPLRDLRNLRENIHARVLNQSTQRNPNVSRWFRWWSQTKPKTTLTTNCLSLRYNAACCIPLRHLRYLRENNTQEYSINIHRRNPSISRRFTQTKPKTTLISPNCLSLRNNAACCIPLRDLRYLRENTRKSTQSIGKEETPMSPADFADSRRQTTKPQNHKTTKQH